MTSSTRAPSRRTPSVAPSNVVVGLTVCIGVLALVATTVGLVWSGGAAPESVMSVRGEQVELYGEGLYRFDSVFKGAGNRGTDLVTLVVGLPLLWWATRGYRRGSVAGGLLLAGALTWFLYVYASLSLSAAYNEMFLVHVALVSTSLWALVLTVRSIRLEDLPPEQAARLPRRGLARLLVAAGTLTALVWLQPILVTLPSGGAPPMLQHSTTLVTEVLDLAVVAPAAVVAGLLVHRRRWPALALAVPLLVLLVVLAFAILAQTAAQLMAGWQYTVPELAGPLGGFLVLGGLAAWLLVRTLAALAAPAVPMASRGPRVTRSSG
jgi:hypothetical protein